MTRAALLDAAIDLFVERGVEGTSIEEVTSHAGFSRGAFYSNFDSKDDLFVEAVGRFLVRLHEAAAATDDEPGDTAAAYVARLKRMQEVFGNRGQRFLAEIALYAIRKPHLIDPVAALHQQQLAPAIAFVSDKFSVEGAEAEDLANVMQSLNFGLLLFALVDPALDPDRLLAYATRLFASGLGHLPPAPSQP